MVAMPVILSRDDSDTGAFSGRFDIMAPLLPLLNFTHQALEIDLGLHCRAVGSRCPIPHIAAVHVGACRQQRPDGEKMTVGAGKVHRRVALDIGLLNGLFRTARHIRQQQLEHGIVAAHAGHHDGIAAADVTPQNAVWVVLAKLMNDFSAPGSRCQHQRSLVVLVECGTRILVAGLEQDFADIAVAERGGEVEVRVGEALLTEIWVMEQARVRVENASNEKSIVCMDRTPDANGRVDPRAGVSGSHSGLRIGSDDWAERVAN